MSTTTFEILRIPEATREDIKAFKEFLVSQLVAFGKSKKFNIEFEIRLGTYYGKLFNQGASYEEFSRFYTYLEENCVKIESQNYLDIYSKRFTLNGNEQIRVTLAGSENIMNYCSSNMLPLDTQHVTYQSKKSQGYDIQLLDIRLALGKEQIFSSADIAVIYIIML